MCSIVAKELRDMEEIKLKKTIVKLQEDFQQYSEQIKEEFHHTFIKLLF